ncbi:hypothetical protein EON80_26795, partial [bacterium]
MSPFSALERNIIVFLLLSVLWLMVAGLYFAPSFAALPLIDRSQAILAFLLGEGMIIALIHHGEKRSVQRSEHAKTMAKISLPRVSLYEALSQLPDFALDQWCVLPSLTGEGERAVAVNRERTRIALLDYHPPATKRTTNPSPSIRVKVLEASDVTSVVIEESAPDVSRKLSNVRLASELLGSAGLPILHPQMLADEENSQATRSTAPIPSPEEAPAQHRRVNGLVLKVTLGASESPIETLPFLLGEASVSDQSYLFARENDGENFPASRLFIRGPLAVARLRFGPVVRS